MQDQTCLGSAVHCGVCIICQQVAEHKKERFHPNPEPTNIWERKTTPRTSGQTPSFFPRQAWEFEGGPR